MADAIDPGPSVADDWPLEDLLDLAVRAAEEAGQLAQQRGRAGSVKVAATKTSLTDVVTEVDREVEQLLRGVLLDARPGDAWLGEETGASEGATESHQSAVRWVVDPIDGTVNFLYGLPGWAVSVAGEQWGETVVAAVVVPATGETFSAIRGRGAHLAGQRLAVSTCNELSQALVATGFAYQPHVRARQGPVVGELVSKVRDIRRMGAAAVDLCSLAAGRVDAYFEAGLNPWDLAAGELIAREAGASVNATADGDVVAAGPELIASFSAELARLQ